MRGNLDDDTLNGTSGDDTLNGGAGGDLMRAATAATTVYFVDDADDDVVELVGEGAADKVNSGIDY